MESINLRTSYVNDINYIRKKLWESVYSDFEIMNTLTKCLYMTFSSLDPYPINTISFDFDTLKFSINLLRPISNIEMNSILSIAFGNFVDEIYNNNRLSQNEYEICRKRVNMLFSLILNTETIAEVTL